MNEKIIDVIDLSKSYGKKSNKTNVLNDVSFSVEKGDFVVIHGESGSGKSTLLNLLAGFDKADSGNILIKNVDISKLNESKRALFRRKNVGFVFQQYHLLPELSALENVMLPLVMNKVNRRTAKREALKLLNYVGIESSSANKKPEEFSGGQDQRIAIARALVCKPEVVFADEPTGNLDSKNRETVLKLLQSVNKDFNTTILMVTHSIKEREISEKQIEIKDGRIL